MSLIRQVVIIAEAGFNKKLDRWFPFKYQIHDKPKFWRWPKGGSKSILPQ